MDSLSRSALSSDTPAIRPLEPGNGIPKLIHQVWHDKKNIPPELRTNIDDIKSRNPAWTHALYDLSEIENFIGKHYGSGILEIYRAINPDYIAARADFFRYLLMYALGGVYLDIKSTTQTSLDTALRADDRFILSHWDNSASGTHPGWGKHPRLAALPRGEYQQWFIAAAPGHPYLKAVIERVIANIRHYKAFRDGVGKVGVLATTGPIPYSLAIHSMRDEHPHRDADARRELGIIYSIYEHAAAKTDHRKVFGKHYTTLATPVVSGGKLHDAAVSIACRLLIKLRLMEK